MNISTGGFPSGMDHLIAQYGPEELPPQAPKRRGSRRLGRESSRVEPLGGIIP
jgi:hypothetical protein